MYRFLDRPIVRLADHNRFLVEAMRRWTHAARTGRCSCAALAGAFRLFEIAPALPHFAITMHALDQEGVALLRFGDIGSSVTSEDEARMLALFASALEGDAPRAYRIAAGLVAPDAVARLATAVGMVALHLLQTTIKEDDQ